MLVAGHQHQFRRAVLGQAERLDPVVIGERHEVEAALLGVGDLLTGVNPSV